jgi:hypothetical protein
VSSGEELKRPYPEVARCHARKHCSWQRPLAHDRLTGRDGRQGACSWNTGRVHELADEVLAKHWPERGLAIATTRERCGTRALEMKIAADPTLVDELSDQKRPPISQLRGKSTELMTSVGLRQRRCVLG